MKLVQEHIIRSNHQDYRSLMDLCHLSKNLYNAGLYKSKDGRLMNADINGSLNIMRKYTKVSPDELFQGVEGLVFNPRVI